MRFFRWVASWFRRQSLLDSLGTVPAHRQSRFTRDGDAL